MFFLVWRAFSIPLRSSFGIIKIFWPLVAIAIIYSYLLPFLFNMLPYSHRNIPEVSTLMKMPEGGVFTILVLFLMAVFICYALMLIYDGLIKWHRYLILNDRPRALNIFPQKRNWPYIGWSLLFLIIALLIHFLFIRRLFPPLVLELPLDPALYLQAINMTMLRYALSLLLFTALLARRFLLLPKAAVQDSSFDVAIDLSFSEKAGWTTAVLFTVSLFLAVLYVIWRLAPIPEFAVGPIPFWVNQGDFLLPFLGTIFLLFYTGFVLLTLLSLGYRRVVYGE